MLDIDNKTLLSSSFLFHNHANIINNNSKKAVSSSPSKLYLHEWATLLWLSPFVLLCFDVENYWKESQTRPLRAHADLSTFSSPDALVSAS